MSEDYLKDLSEQSRRLENNILRLISLVNSGSYLKDNFSINCTKSARKEVLEILRDIHEIDKRSKISMFKRARREGVIRKEAEELIKLLSEKNINNINTKWAKEIHRYFNLCLAN